jgi:hypothetical protein
LPCNPSGKARLDVAHTPRKIGVALGQFHWQCTGQVCGVPALACWSTPYVGWFRCNGPGSCIDLNDRFWACLYNRLMPATDKSFLFLFFKKEILAFFVGARGGIEWHPTLRRNVDEIVLLPLAFQH